MCHFYLNSYKRLMEEQHLLALIDKFLNGTANSFEKKQLDDWYQKNNEEETVWLSDTPDEEELIQQKMLLKIKEHVVGTRTPIRSLYRRMLLKVAAVLAGLSLFTGYYFYKMQSVSPHTATLSASMQASEKLLENKYILLPDSSTVLLHSGSKISYSFNGKTRELTLEGEAYFDIKHIQSQPFIIHTGKVTTTVIGTAFNIKAYPNHKIIVSVTRGRVKVADGNKKLLAILVPDQQVVYNELTRVTNQNKVNALQIIEWANSDMQFSDMPFKQLADRLSRRYNVEVKFQHAELENCLITGRFNGTEPLDSALKIVAATMATTYTVNGNIVTIDGKGCN